MQFLAFGKVFERVDFIDTERNDLKVRHSLDDLQVFKLVSPEVEVFDVVEVV